MKEIRSKEEIKAYLKTVIWGVGVCLVVGVFMTLNALMSGVKP